MSTQKTLAMALALAGLFLLPLRDATAQGDETLFFASGGAPPNLLLLLDTSGSMGGEPSNVDD